MPSITIVVKIYSAPVLQTKNAWKFPGGLSDQGENIGECHAQQSKRLIQYILLNPTILVLHLKGNFWQLGPYSPMFFCCICPIMYHVRHGELKGYFKPQLVIVCRGDPGIFF